MTEVVYKNLGELVKEAKEKYGFHHEHGTKRYPVNHRKSRTSTTGFSRVLKLKSPNYKQGFCYLFRYTENGKNKVLSSVDILKLRKKIIDKGYNWEIIDEVEAAKVAKLHKIDLDDLR